MLKKYKYLSNKNRYSQEEQGRIDRHITLERGYVSVREDNYNYDFI